MLLMSNGFVGVMIELDWRALRGGYVSPRQDY